MAIKRTPITEFNAMQKAFVKWGINKQKMLMRAPAGSGKSLAAMLLYEMLSKHTDMGKVLVITKKKASDMFDEANFKKRLLLKVLNEEDTCIFSAINYEFPADVYVINISVLRDLVNGDDVQKKRGLTALLRKVGLLIGDEVHDWRTYSNKSTQAVKRVTEYYHKLIARDPVHHRLLGITATPVYRNLEDYHGIFALLEPSLFGSWFKFRDSFLVTQEVGSYGTKRVHGANGSHSYKAQTTFTKVVGYKNVDMLYRMIEPYIFQWDETDFKFSFGLHYYSLTMDELTEYTKNIQGLGLDKEYCIEFSIAGKINYMYRNRNDTVVGFDGKEILVGTLRAGTGIVMNGIRVVVQAMYTKDKDGTYTARMVKAQQTTTKSESAVVTILELIKAEGKSGALVYCHYIDTVDYLAEKIQKEFPGRRVVKLTGKTKGFDTLVKSLSAEDIVIMSSVASQSLNFYFKRLIVAQVASVTPGRIEQLIGRLTRTDSPYREIVVDFVLERGSVSDYFYEYLRYRLQYAKTNVYSKDLPVSESMAGIPPSLIDQDYLKEKLLWSRK
jgi:superfamily II DNA or RNA helicase